MDQLTDHEQALASLLREEYPPEVLDWRFIEQNLQNVVTKAGNAPMSLEYGYGPSLRNKIAELVENIESQDPKNYSLLFWKSGKQWSVTEFNQKIYDHSAFPAIALNVLCANGFPYANSNPNFTSDHTYKERILKGINENNAKYLTPLAQKVWGLHREGRTVGEKESWRAVHAVAEERKVFLNNGFTKDLWKIDYDPYAEIIPVERMRLNPSLHDQETAFVEYLEDCHKHKELSRIAIDTSGSQKTPVIRLEGEVALTEEQVAELGRQLNAALGFRFQSHDFLFRYSKQDNKPILQFNQEQMAKVLEPVEYWKRGTHEGQPTAGPIHPQKRSEIFHAVIENLPEITRKMFATPPRVLDYNLLREVSPESFSETKTPRYEPPEPPRERRLTDEQRTACEMAAKQMAAVIPDPAALTTALPVIEEVDWHQTLNKAEIIAEFFNSEGAFEDVAFDLQLDAIGGPCMFQEQYLQKYLPDNATISRGQLYHVLQTAVTERNQEGAAFGSMRPSIGFMKEFLAQAKMPDNEKTDALSRMLKLIWQSNLREEKWADGMSSIANIQTAWNGVGTKMKGTPMTQPQYIKGKDAVWNALLADLERQIPGFSTTFLFEGQGNYNPQSIRTEFKGYMYDEIVMTPETVKQAVAAVKKDCDLKQEDHPFNLRRGHYSLVKAIADYSQLECNGAYPQLTDAQKERNKEAIVSQADTYKADSDPSTNAPYFPLIQNAERTTLESLYDHLGTGDLTAFQNILAGKRVPAPLPVAQSSATTTTTTADNKEPVAFWKPLAALLGAVGIAYAASGKEEQQPTEGKENEEPKKQSWFKPVLKWLGIAAAAIATVELGYSLAKKPSPIVGPVTARLFSQRSNAPSTPVPGV